MIQLEQLRQFLIVAELRNFTKAAEALYVSHSTISRSVSFLEQELGVLLFNRDARSVSLTPAGTLLYERGSELMAQIEEMEHSVHMAGQGIDGVLTVSSENYYVKPLFDAYRFFRRKYPNIDLIINRHELRNVLLNVQHNQADIGLTFSYMLNPEDDSIAQVKVGSGRFCLVAADHYDPQMLAQIARTGDTDLPYLTLTKLTTTNANEHTEIYQFPFRNAILEKLEKNMRKAATLESVMLQIRAGIGFAVLPYHVYEEYGHGCQVVELEDWNREFDVVLIYKRNNTNRTLPLFLDLYEKISNRECCGGKQKAADSTAGADADMKE